MSAWERVVRGRVSIFAVLCALLLAACTAGSGSPVGRSSAVHSAGSSTRPNIIFVLTDDLSTNLVQYMPHVLGLERTGTTLKNYFVVDSLCCPSRSAIFTGEYPHDDGVFTNNAGTDGGYFGFKLHNDASKTYAVSLHNSGYRTAMMGKYLNGYNPTDPVAPGWDEWDVAGNGYPEYDYQLNQNGAQQFYGRKPKDYLTTVLAGKAKSFIDDSAKRHQPFALEVATFAPHQPYVPAPVDNRTFPTLNAPHAPSYDRSVTDATRWLRNRPPLTPRQVKGINYAFRRRVESVQAVDLMIGTLEREVANKGLLSNTYFVFSSDNGFHLGDYRLVAGKQTPFDTDIHVPLVVSGPGVPAGGRVSALTSSIDLAPTFDRIAGAKPAGTPDGVSLLSLWHGAAVPSTWQQAVLIEHHRSIQPASDPDKQNMYSGDPPSYEAIRTASAMYVQYDTGESGYFRLRTDPYELHNVAATAPGSELAPLRATLAALEHCHGARACQAADQVK